MDTSSKNLRAALPQAKRVVVKAGTHVLVNKNGQPNQQRIKAIVSQLVALTKQGHEVIFVSSGAIGCGMHALKMQKRPSALPELQMAAAVGQTRLIAYYNELFQQEGCQIGQVLLTHDDLRHRRRHLNARNTLLKLLQHGIIPIINENDTIAVDEIKVGDNDVLSALVSVLVEADLLILLTTPDGLRAPTTSGKTRRVSHLGQIDEEALALAFGKRSELSTGGMATKLKAAQVAMTTGTRVVIASGYQKDVIQKIIAGLDVGTLICKTSENNPKASSRKRWISYFHRSQGSLIVDLGAQNALHQQGKSLLPVGVMDVVGQFNPGTMVSIVTANHHIIGYGLVEYSSEDILKIKGQHTREIEKILGSKDYDEIIHRDNLVIIDKHLK